MNFYKIALPLCATTVFVIGINPLTADDATPTSRENYGAPASAWTAIEAKVATQPPGSDSTEKKYLAMRISAKKYYEEYKGWTAPIPPPLPEGQLRNLPEAPTQPRFPLTGKDWPEKSGDASICLWKDDKVAVISFMLWGAVPGSLVAAGELAKKYPGARFSSSLIVGYTNHPSLHPGVTMDQPNPDRWDVDKNAFAQGIHFMSQSMTWCVDPVFEDGWPGPEWECAESIHQIDSNIPGNKTRVLDAPGSYMGAFNVSKSWKPVITQYFLAELGPLNGGINPANQIDYFNISGCGCQTVSATRPDPTVENDPNPKPDNFSNLLNADPKNPNYKYYRGWLIPNTHILEADTTKPGSALYGKALDFYARHQDDIWSGCIDDVAMYGEERDTATLTISEASDARIGLNLTSKMDPASFDFPLTIKVHLPASWKTIEATQDGKNLSATIIAHEGNNFGLVQIVPNHGAVMLQPK